MNISTFQLIAYKYIFFISSYSSHFCCIRIVCVFVCAVFSFSTSIPGFSDVQKKKKQDSILFYAFNTVSLFFLLDFSPSLHDHSFDFACARAHFFSLLTQKIYSEFERRRKIKNKINIPTNSNDTNEIT